MAKFYSFQKAVSFIFIVLFFSSHLKAFDEVEDNGSFELANTISQGESVNGTIGASGDVNDYFLSVPANDGTINLQFSFSSTDSNSDFFVFVYNKNGSLLESNFLYNVGIGESNDSVIVYCRQQDSLYFRINSTGTLDYTFSYNSIESGNLDSEPNDDFDQAQFLAFNDTAKGRIGYASVGADNNDYFKHFKPENIFIKWTAAEVHDLNNLPEGFESFIIPKGKYAVFKPDSGKADDSFYQKVFTLWLPESGYTVDDRPHFEVITPLSDLPNHYKEVIYIPIFPYK